jgi:hypothetical protein
MMGVHKTLLLPLLCLWAPLGSIAVEPACDANKLLNSAFVFIKPHANTHATQNMVKNKLNVAGIEILSEHDISGETIDKDKLIDQHYYAIASKATILPAEEIPVPADRFLSEFGESWETVLSEKRACNAMDACKRFDCTPEELNEAWGQAKKVVKFGGGFYCGLVSVKEQPPLYVFNAFFMTMRGKFVVPGSSIHCYVVQWDPSNMSWANFRNEFLGYVKYNLTGYCTNNNMKTRMPPHKKNADPQIPLRLRKNLFVVPFLTTTRNLD